jgi:hypothetical protein
MQALRSSWIPIVLGGTVLVLLIQQQFFVSHQPTHGNGNGNGGTLTDHNNHERALMLQLKALNDSLKVAHHESMVANTELSRAQETLAKTNQLLTQELNASANLRAQLNISQTKLKDVTSTPTTPPSSSGGVDNTSSITIYGDAATMTEICQRFRNSKPFDVPLFCQPVHTVIGTYLIILPFRRK